MTMRYDRVELKATTNADGYLIDTPVLTRTGVFEYRNPDGTTRREYRPPQEVFHADSLRGYRGIPITLGHPGRVTKENVRRHMLGTVLTEGRQDQESLTADIVIYDPSPVEKEGFKELSVGYSLDLDETPGTTPDGERYDAIQTNIRPNHLALVKKGRAGTARLNLDAADVAEPEEENMVKVKLKNGLSYDAAPEVAQELEAAQAALAAATARADAAEARADSLDADLQKANGEKDQLRQDATAAARARLQLEATAAGRGVAFKQDATDREIQEAIIRSVRGESFKMDGKSDDYVQAAFDLAVAESAEKKKVVVENRKQMNQDSAPEKNESASAARQRYVAGLSGKE